MKDNFERFMISQAAVLIRDDKCLIMQYADNKEWGLPGGRIDKGETGKATLQRELKEEIGISKFEYMGVADYDFYYYKKGADIIAKCNLINLIKNDTEKLIFSKEHSDFRWITEGEINEYKFSWPNMERLIRNGFKLKRLLEKNGE